MPADPNAGKPLRKGEGAASAKESGEAAKGADKAGGSFKKAADAAQKYGSALFKYGASGMKAFGGALKSISSGPLPGATEAMTKLGEAAGSVISGAGEKLNAGLSAIGDQLSKLGPEGEAAGIALKAVGAIAQSAAEFIGATVGVLGQLMGMAIEVNEQLGIMRARFSALAGGAAGGAKVEAMVNALAKELPFATSQIAGWAQALLGAGIKGKQLEDDIKAIAAANALMGESGGAAAETLFKRLGEGGPAADKLLQTFVKGGPKADKLLKEMGLSLADLGGKAAVAKMTADQLHEALARAMAKKGAGPLEELGLTFPAILQKAREGFMSIFSKLGGPVKAFMKSVKDLFGNFNKGTPTIKALSKVATELLGGLFKYATMAAKALSGMFKGGSAAKTILSIWNGIKAAVKGVIAVLAPAIALWKALYKNAFLMNGIKTIFKIIGAVILFVVGLVVLFIATIFGIIGAIGAVVGAVVGFVGGILGALGDLVSGAWDAASNFISGLIGGITGGKDGVINSAIDVAKGAVDAVKSFLGIASPSKVMARMGGFASAGMAQGLDAGTGKVEAAGARVGDAAAGGAAGGMGGGTGKGGKGVSVTIAAGAVVIHAGGATITDEGLAAALERLLMAQGLGAR